MHACIYDELHSTWLILSQRQLLISHALISEFEFEKYVLFLLKVIKEHKISNVK